MAVSFEYDPDLKVIERNLSTLLDVLADVGGLETALVTVCTVIVNFINGAKLQNFLIGSLYSHANNRSLSQRESSKSYKPSNQHCNFFSKRRRQRMLQLDRAKQQLN